MRSGTARNRLAAPARPKVGQLRRAKHVALTSAHDDDDPGATGLGRRIQPAHATISDELSPTNRRN